MTLDCDKLHTYLGQRRASGAGEFNADKVTDDEDEENEDPRVTAHDALLSVRLPHLTFV